MDQFVGQVFSLAARVARSINSISPNPSTSLESELQYLRTVYPDQRLKIDKIRTGLCSLANKIASCTKDKEAPWTEVRNVRETYAPKVVDVLDSLLERIDDNLDSFFGKTAKHEIERPTTTSSKRKRLQLEEDPEKVIKPQDRQIFIVDSGQHPYEAVIKAIEYPEALLLPPSSPLTFPSLEETKCTWIQTPEELQRLACELHEQKLIAVDLEHHSFHSYYGFTCLIQLSTREADYIIDAIRLRSVIGSLLGPIFANPAILKLFHGAQSDIQWLQRDFNIFIVNMFDTFLASKSLELASHSLASLLQRYAQITLDKQYQLADWRMRPLPIEMRTYARMDTHYLPYLFDRMRQDLHEKGGSDAILSVLKRSSASAKALYRAEQIDENSWRTIVEKSSAPFTDRELAIIKILYYWRDRIARQEDESPPAVMPNYMIIRIAQTSYLDPEVILRNAKIPFHVALRNIESMRQALSQKELPLLTRKKTEEEEALKTKEDVNPTSIHVEEKLKSNEESVKPASVHIEETFKGNKESGDFASIPLPSKPSPSSFSVNVALAKSTGPKMGRVSFAPTSKAGMAANLFTQAAMGKRVRDGLEDAHIASKLSISKVTRVAASTLGISQDSESAREEGEKESQPEQVDDVEDNPVVILRTGEVIEEEALLGSTSTAEDPKIILARPKSNQPVTSATPRSSTAKMDLSSRAQLLLTERRGEANDASKAQQINPNKKRTRNKGNKTESSRKSFRLGVNPIKGNRSMTFSMK